MLGIWLAVVAAAGLSGPGSPSRTAIPAKTRGPRELGPQAAALRRTLECLSESDRFIFGHQLTNTNGRASPRTFPLLPPFHPGATPPGGFADCAAAVNFSGDSTWSGCQQAVGTLSDVHNASGGLYPGLFGFDWQWAVGVAYPAVYPNPPHVPKIPKSLIPGFSFNPFIAHARRVGALVTIDMHVVNPITLVQHDPTGKPITALLPGGAANAMWTSWLDGLVAQVKADPNNAFILRPFHECTIGLNLSHGPAGTAPPKAGGWWWSAKAGTTPAEYRAAWNYTRWYVEEFKGAQNVLWAYAPNSPTTCYPSHPGCTAASYSDTQESYYPGDDNVDIVCFDRYGKNDYSADLLADCGVVTDFARAHGKIPAICETGVGGGVQNTNLTDYFTNVLLESVARDPKCGRIAYMLTWSEGPLFAPPGQLRKDPTYYVPVEGDPLAPDFLQFSRDNRTVFAGELGSCGGSIGVGCVTDDDCSLLGTCDTAAGRCHCDIGWTGPDCATAAFAPLNLTEGYHNATAASWGGRPLQDLHDPSVWHMYVAQFTKKCSLAYWLSNSVVARVTSRTGPAGPYSYAETVFPEFHHNPTVLGPTSDGFYLMYLIGKTNRSNVANCERNPDPFTPNPGLTPSAGTISMAWAQNPAGPWSNPKVVLHNYDRPDQNQSGWDCKLTNPTAVIHPDGSIMLVFSSVPCTDFEEALGFAVAPHWNATYVQNPTAIWRKPGPARGPGGIGVGNVEDPFVWVDGRGNYHIVAHSQGNMNLCGGPRIGSANDYGNACGVHFFARTPQGSWKHSRSPVYTGSTLLSNDTAAAFTTRQRPQIVFGPDGITPMLMVNGGSFVEYNRGTTALERTFIFRFAGAE